LNSTEENILIKACLKGDREAQHRLYQANKVFLYGLCLRYSKNKIEAEDMLQEGFYDFSLLEKDRAQAIIQLIKQLPIAHKTVFNLKAIDGYEYKEIAEQLEMKETTVRSHYLRARKKLQQLLVNELH